MAGRNREMESRGEGGSVWKDRVWSEEGEMDILKLKVGTSKVMRQ